VGAGERTGADMARELVRHSPFANHVGIRLESLEPDTAEVALDYHDEVATVPGLVHGGAISTLVDVAATLASWSTPDGSVPSAGTTVGLTVDFLRAARGIDLRALGRVVKRGRSLCFVDVEVTGPDGDLVAKGLVTYKVG
jgi:uncharacterized protein (TIGR00369 family)